MMAAPGPSETGSEFAASEMPMSEPGEASPARTVGGFPPYPPYAMETVPPSLADAIIAGRDIRVKHKSVPPMLPVRPAPKPARPRGPKVTDVKLNRRATRAYARCLRRHNAVLTDRLERMSKPPRRTVISFWRENAHNLPASTINRLRAMLDADEPFKPDQAYQFFINMKKSKKRVKQKEGILQIKKGMAMCDKRFQWARNATVAFARGIQQRLAKPGRYALADGMLRLSNIVLDDLCAHMNMKSPSRRCQNPKSKFMMEMSDKVAVWIDEILCESDDRMLMMDFDEDDDVINELSGGGGDGGAGFADDFLNMMGGGGLLTGPQHAYLKFSGDMQQAFTILTDAMKKKGNQQLLEHGKFKQTYSEAADELKSTPDFTASEYNCDLAKKVNGDLTATAAPDTPSNLKQPMKEIVNICSNFLAQHAEMSKDKGKAFQVLVKAMKAKSNEPLYQKGKSKSNMGKAAKDLEAAKGLESDHDDPNLSQEIHQKLSKLVSNLTTPELKTDMAETLDLASKYLSQNAVDENERGPAFDHLIKTLEKAGRDPFTPEHPVIATKYDAAYALKSAPGFSSVVPDRNTIGKFDEALHKAVDTSTPAAMAGEMKGVIPNCAGYLSALVRDRDKAMGNLIQMMKKNPSKVAAKRNSYSMNYGDGATELETAPTLTPFLPIKDIADEVKKKLAADMESITPADLKLAVKTAVGDAAKFLSQSIALRSGAAGERYPLNFLAAVASSLGDRPLFNHKGFSMTYSDGAEVLKFAGPLESDSNAKELENQISAELNRGLPIRLAPSTMQPLAGVIKDASKHLAKTGMAKGNALSHLTSLMKEKGDAPLAVLQGYQQSYGDAALRLENAPSLATDKVDKGAYAKVSAKLHALNNEKPSKENEEHMPGIIEDASKYLSAPMPETEADKRKILSDLMKRKGNEIFDEDKQFKLTYSEAGDEILNAPVGKTKGQDLEKTKQNVDKINKLIPDRKLEEQLKNAVNEGAAHLADFVTSGGRPESDLERCAREEAARRKMLGLPPETEFERRAREEAQRRERLGLPPETDEERRAREERERGGPESDLERSAREEAERRKRLGLPPETEFERRAREEAERRKRLGLPPETDEERRAREQREKGGPESDLERSAREEAERRKRLGLPPETELERRAREEAERRKRLGLPPETDEERRAREERERGGPESEAERRKRLGLPPETDEERRAREERERGGPESEAERRKRLGLPPETDEERRAREERERGGPESEAERRKRLGLPPETEFERRAREEAERRKRLGLPPETDEERRAREERERGGPESEAERRKRLGLPPETEFERRAREEAERRKRLGLPPETDEERRAREQREKGGPESDLERSAREEAERRKRLGLPPETEFERRAREEAERRKRLGLPPETDEERRAREQREKGGPESDLERSARGEAERRKRLGLPPETEFERRAREEAERRKRLGLPPETDAERKAREEKEGKARGGAGEDAERRKRAEAARRGGAGAGGEFDPEREAALRILHTQLKAKGGETFYKQPQTELTHSEASDWLKSKPSVKVDKTVKESADTARLSNKFERKLSNLVSKATPADMYDVMQDVVIESARNLAEIFVSKNYATLVKEGLIAEMQKKGNEILIEDNGATETCFFAAQRLKKAQSYEAKEPCDKAAYHMTKKLEEIVRCRTMPRKLTSAMKEHIKEAANYLSALVIKPESDIEAYVALLEEMEATGDTLLFEGDIPKSYKDSAAYLRTLTSTNDLINRSDGSLKSRTESNLKNMMANVPPRGYQSTHLAGAISYASKFLVSYIKLQGEKTEVLKSLRRMLESGGSGVLLRHGEIRKSYANGAEILKGKNADQLSVSNAEPVVTRKIQIKLLNLVEKSKCIPPNHQVLLNDVIEDATAYLAIYLLQPRVIQVCKCMKNVFVQCELWCEEILRRVARPCCTCSRHVSAQALADLAPPGQRLRVAPGGSRALAPGLEVCLTTCPSPPAACPAACRSPGCRSRTYNVMYSACQSRPGSPPRADLSCTNHSYLSDMPTSSKTSALSGVRSPAWSGARSPALSDALSGALSPVPTGARSPVPSGARSPAPSGARSPVPTDALSPTLSGAWSPAPSGARSPAVPLQFLHVRDSNLPPEDKSLSGESSYFTASQPSTLHADAVLASAPFWQSPNTMLSKLQKTPLDKNYSTRTPIVSTDQMADWHAMMVSLMWNVQAWRDWIQENIERGLSYQKEAEISAAEAEDNWATFQRRVSTESLQWRQYNNFSRQLTVRLALRYRDKTIVSPTRATNQTATYMKCAEEMLEIIDMFNRWTQWLTAVVKETNLLTQTPEWTEDIHKLRWSHFKMKVLEYLDDWTKYNDHLKVCWELKYRTDWLPAWKHPGPVWVVSACGAVPSGAVSGGVYDNEVIWVARTTHRCNVLPAALRPSKHCCIVYADGGVHHYTKYQVICNAEVEWRAWRAGVLGARAVRVAPGTHVGRVHYRGSHLIGAVHAPNYRCHVVIFGRPFAFNCYELLILSKDETPA